MISNHMPGKVWDEITYPFPHFNCATHGRKSRITRNTYNLVLYNVQVKLQVARWVQVASNDILVWRCHYISKYHSIKPIHYIQPRPTQLQTIIIVYNLTSIYIYVYIYIYLYIFIYKHPLDNKYKHYIHILTEIQSIVVPDDVFVDKIKKYRIQINHT